MGQQSASDSWFSIVKKRASLQRQTDDMSGTSYMEPLTLDKGAQQGQLLDGMVLKFPKFPYKIVTDCEIGGFQGAGKYLTGFDHPVAWKPGDRYTTHILHCG